MSMDVASICSNAQQCVLNAIPEKWRIDAHKFKGNLDSRDVPAKSGVLSPKQLEITEQTATQLLESMHTGKLTSTEVTEAFCARAAIAHQMVNCLTEFFPEEAMQTARRLDEEFAKSKKPIGPLHGLPIAIKDMYELKGHLSTFGYVSWHSNRPQQDASLVKVMKDAGVIIFGKTTMPQTGMALETWSNLWGRTLNPYNSKFGSGGSSGGDGALVAMRGAPCAPLSSDIGGSIRAPGAFNGLYAMRPSADRVPRSGILSTAPGQVSIKVSCGPNCHSMTDLSLLVRQILSHPTLPYEPTCIPGRWEEPEDRTRKLRIGVMSDDGVVKPHPPILRAIRESSEKLRIQGHEIVEFNPPFDLWEVAETTWALYFQTGAVEIKAAIAKSGESTLPTFQHNLDIFKTRPLTVPELFKLNVKQAEYKAIFSEAWTAANVDLLLCPCAPAAGAPHGFPLWWGYTTLWNILDLPSIIMPLRKFKIDLEKDAKEKSYQGRSNPFDKENFEQYDPELWANQPVTLQIVGRQCRDEQLIADCEKVDAILNEI